MRAKQQHVCKEMNIYEQYQPGVVFKGLYTTPGWKGYFFKW